MQAVLFLRELYKRQRAGQTKAGRGASYRDTSSRNSRRLGPSPPAAALRAHTVQSIGGCIVRGEGFVVVVMEWFLT